MSYRIKRTFNENSTIDEVIEFVGNTDLAVADVSWRQDTDGNITLEISKEIS